MTKSPTRATPEKAAYEEKEVIFSPLPTHAIRLSGYLKALRKIGSLERGKIYAINLVTDKGMVQIYGDIDRLYPMAAFGHPSMHRLGIELTGSDDAEH